MDILYHSPAYHAAHGGRNHAREFVKAACTYAPELSVQVFPKAEQFKQTKTINTSRHKQYNQNLRVLVGPRLWRLRNLYYAELVREISAHRPDVIHFRHGPHFLQLLSIRRAFPDILVSVEVNASPFDESIAHAWPRSMFQHLEKYVLQQCHLCFYVSGPLKDRIMGKSADESRDIVVPNGVDLERFRRTRSTEAAKNALGIAPDSPVIGYVGGMDAFRRLDLLIEGFTRVRKEYSNAVLLLVGDGPQSSELRALTEARGMRIGQDVRLTGWVPSKDVPSLMEAFDAAVQNNAQPYMSPQKLFEYMGMGLPVIGPDIASVRELFCHEKHILLTSNHPEAIQVQITRLLGNPEFAQMLAAQGREHIADRYTWKHNAQRIIQRWTEHR